MHLSLDSVPQLTQTPKKIYYVRHFILQIFLFYYFSIICNNCFIRCCILLITGILLALKLSVCNAYNYFFPFKAIQDGLSDIEISEQSSIVSSSIVDGSPPITGLTQSIIDKVDRQECLIPNVVNQSDKISHFKELHYEDAVNRILDVEAVNLDLTSVGLESVDPAISTSSGLLDQIPVTNTTPEPTVVLTQTILDIVRYFLLDLDFSPLHWL